MAAIAAGDHRDRRRMIQVDLQASFLVGSAVALVGRRRLREADDDELRRVRTVALAYASTVFAPVWLYITWRWTGWEMMYFWDRDTVPEILIAAFLPGIALAALAGFWITEKLVCARRMGAAFAVIGAVFASCVAVAIWGWERVNYVGTVAGFEAGERGNLVGSDLFYAFGVVSLLVFLPTAILAIRWLRDKD